MPPLDFQSARNASADAPLYCALVDGRPYLPNVSATADTSSNFLSVSRAAVAVVVAAAKGTDGEELSSLPSDDELSTKLTVKVVSGGITNSLYRVSGLTELDAIKDLDGVDESVLVRVFGE